VLGATTIAHGVASYGNYLVVAEVRATGNAATGGVWLDVFDARAIRDRQASTTLALSNRVAQLQFVPSAVSTPAGLPLVDVSVSLGRAVVSIDTSSTTLADNVWFVNLNPLFDDDPSTTFGPAQVQGSLQTPGTRRTVVVGTFAYAATTAGLRIFDVTNAVDGPLWRSSVESRFGLGLGFDGLGFDRRDSNGRSGAGQGGGDEFGFDRRAFVADRGQLFERVGDLLVSDALEHGERCDRVCLRLHRVDPGSNRAQLREQRLTHTWSGQTHARCLEAVTAFAGEAFSPLELVARNLLGEFDRPRSLARGADGIDVSRGHEPRP